MRTILFSLLLTLHVFYIKAQGVEYFEGTYEEALAEAQRTGKNIFLDIYTQWCQPCKMLKDEVFTQPDVGEFMNTHFITLLVDAEKGKNSKLARKFNVSAYPTLVFLLPSGRTEMVFKGASNKEGFMRRAEGVLQQINYKNAVLIYDQRWQQGDRDPEMVKTYLQLRKSLSIPNDTVLSAYLSGLSEGERLSPETEKLVVNGVNQTEGVGFEYLLANKKSKRCRVKLSQLLDELAEKAIETRSDKSADLYCSLVASVVETDWESALKQGAFRSLYLLETGQNNKYLSFTSKLSKEVLLPNLNQDIYQGDSLRYAEHRVVLEHIGWQYAQYINQQKALKEAFNWLETINQTLETISALGYQALLAKKLGKTDLYCSKLDAVITLAYKQQVSAEAWEKAKAESTCPN